jgi:hypothetical protein
VDASFDERVTGRTGSGAQLAAGAIEAGTDGADGNAEGLGDLLVAEVGPGEQQQDVPVPRRETGQRPGQ